MGVRTPCVTSLLARSQAAAEPGFARREPPPAGGAWG